MRIIKESQGSIGKAVDILKNGGLVIFPTETVYGIGVDATNSKAIEKLNKYKQRLFGKPYSIAVSDQEMAQDYVELNKTAKNLYKQFLPGPMTVISQGKHKVAKGVESENGTLGIRIPAYPLVVEIVKKLGKPITATSANASYQRRPYKISDILDNISKRQKGLIDLIIDVGTLPPNEPSTVIDTTMEGVVILRQGGVKFSDKNEVLSRSEEATKNTAKELWQKYEGHLGKRPLIFALEGPMGAGKTVFTKGLALAMGITEEIVSPTFSLVLNYSLVPSAFSLTHIDAWRMTDANELENLGFVKMLESKNIVIAIEWADRVVSAIKKHRQEAVIIWVKIEYGKKENERIIFWGTI